METPSINAGKAQTWRERVAAQQASGQRVRDWCRQTGCLEHSFYRWRARLGLSTAVRKPRGGTVGIKPVRFIQAVIGPTTTREQLPDGLSVEPIRLWLIGGREVILPASMPIERLARLLRAVEGVCSEPACPEPVEEACPEPVEEACPEPVEEACPERVEEACPEFIEELA
jgi:hypothetical protein